MADNIKNNKRKNKRNMIYYFDEDSSTSDSSTSDSSTSDSSTSTSSSSSTDIEYDLSLLWSRPEKNLEPSKKDCEAILPESSTLQTKTRGDSPHEATQVAGEIKSEESQKTTIEAAQEADKPDASITSNEKKCSDDFEMFWETSEAEEGIQIAVKIALNVASLDSSDERTPNTVNETKADNRNTSDSPALSDKTTEEPMILDISDMVVSRKPMQVTETDAEETLIQENSAKKVNKTDQTMDTEMSLSSSNTVVANIEQTDTTPGEVIQESSTGQTDSLPSTSMQYEASNAEAETRGKC